MKQSCLCILLCLFTAFTAQGQVHRLMVGTRLGYDPSWVGKQLPDSVLVDTAGVPFRLSELRGRVVVINCWFTGCKPCIEELPELAKLVRSSPPGQVAFVAVTFETNERVKPFLPGITSLTGMPQGPCGTSARCG